jgi:hypothetical protein
LAPPALFGPRQLRRARPQQLDQIGRATERICYRLAVAER